MPDSFLSSYKYQYFPRYLETFWFSETSFAWRLTEDFPDIKANMETLINSILLKLTGISFSIMSNKTSMDQTLSLKTNLLSLLLILY